MLRPVLLWFLGISVSVIILPYLFYVVYQIEAGLALQALALTGGLGLTGQSTATKMLAHYRRKVRANRRRLAKD
jgi:hypothetical protein